MIGPPLRPFSAALFAWWLIFALSAAQTGGPPSENVLRTEDDSIVRQSQEQEETVLYFPDYVDGGGWSVQLVLGNVDPEAPAEVRVDVHDPDGRPVLDLFDSDLTVETYSAGSKLSMLPAPVSSSTRTGANEVRLNTIIVLRQAC